MLTWALSLAATAMGQPSLPWQTSTLYDEYGSQDRVLRPWTPVDCEERRLRVWGREMVWQAPSLFPASVTSGGVELLAAPMRLIATTNGRSRPLALTRFTIRERRQSRVTCTAVGEAGGLTATADLWMEYDGFLWVVLTFAQSDPAGRVDALRLEVELPRAGATLYQTFSRPHTGWIGDPPIALPWFANRAEHIANFYHWLGNEDRGLGFTYTSLQHWAPRSDEAFCTIEPGSDTVTYRVNLIESRSSLEGREFQFGIQATPIKRLPPDYHSMVSTGLDYRDWAAWKRLQDGLDSVVIWPPGHMRGLNDPDHVDADALRASVAYVHDRGLAALFTGCPQKVSPLADEFEALRGEWLVHPESVLDWEGTPHYQNCGRSASLRQWLFHGWGPGLVEACGLEGIYYDGWQTGQIACSNGRHRCGWTDAQGMRHATVPVLEGREFNQRMGMFLEDHVRSERVAPSSAPERGDFPDHHYRIHSWEFVPSVMGFATSWLTGEFAAYPLEGVGTLQPEGTLGKCVGSGLFRSRCLSTNWGVPNLFHAVMWEHEEEPPTDAQTQMTYAWLLPHGVPRGELRYMHHRTVVAIERALLDFGTRRAEFRPCWQPNPYVQMAGPTTRDVVVATWAHERGRRVLACVSNLQADRPAEASLRWIGKGAPGVVEALSGESLPMRDGTLSIDLPPERFRLLLFE